MNLKASEPAPAISVLVPTCNYAQYLAEAIESVLQQDFGDFELVISDDASTDASADVIARYARADARIRRHTHHVKIGMVENWNWCLTQARGEYIHFLFGDDKLACSDALGTLLAMLRKHTSAVLASSARILVDEHSKVRKSLGYLGAGLHGLPKVVASCIHEYTNVIGEPSAVLFKKSVANRLFNPSYKQAVDLEMWLALMKKGDLVYAEEPLTLFRVHEAQQSNANRKERTGRRELARLLYSYSKDIAWERLGFSRRQLLFKQLYEMKKTRRLSPDADLPITDVSRQLGFWYAPLWLPYRLQRNAIKLTRWTARCAAR